MSKHICPLCKHQFNHDRGMESCPEPCEQSAVDYNSGSEVDRAYSRLLGAIASPEIVVADDPTLDQILERMLGKVSVDFSKDDEIKEEAKQALEQWKDKAVEEATIPTHIMGKPIEEVVQILSALELERIEDLKMTMDNLTEWMERFRKDHHKAMQRAMDKTFESIGKLNTEESKE